MIRAADTGTAAAMGEPGSEGQAEPDQGNPDSQQQGRSRPRGHAQAAPERLVVAAPGQPGQQGQGEDQRRGGAVQDNVQVRPGAGGGEADQDDDEHEVEDAPDRDYPGGGKAALHWRHRPCPFSRRSSSGA